MPNRTVLLSVVLHFGQSYDAAFRYVRHRVPTALQGSLPPPLDILSARRARKANGRFGKGPLLHKPLRESHVLWPLPAGSDTTRAAPGSEAPAGTRRGGAVRVPPLQRKRVTTSPQIPLRAGTRVADRTQPGATIPPRKRGARSSSLPFGPQPSLP